MDKLKKYGYPENIKKLQWYWVIDKKTHQKIPAFWTNQLKQYGWEINGIFIPDYEFRKKYIFEEKIKNYKQLEKWMKEEAIEEEHSDDKFIQVFAESMKQKMKFSRDVKNRGGWETCPPEILSNMLHHHIQKGDPVDVANFCMMLYHLKSPILPKTTQNNENS